MGTSPQPVASWDFVKLPQCLSSRSSSRGLSFTNAGAELSGPGACLHLQADKLPIKALLKSKSILIGLRFVEKEQISLSLESWNGRRQEQLVLGPYDVWSLQRSDEPKAASFGIFSPLEFDVNVDIHLALVVDASQPPNAVYKCYQNFTPYGDPARLGNVGVFQASEGIAFRIRHNTGIGRVVYSYVKIFDRALTQEELRQIGEQPKSQPSSQSGTGANPCTDFVKLIKEGL